MPHLPGRVVEISSLGAMAKVTLDCGFPLVATVIRSTVEEFGLAQANKPSQQLKQARSILFPDGIIREDRR